MNDGDGKESVNFSSEKGSQQVWRRKKLAIDEFAQAISRMAVAQICESVGFQTFQQSALDSLADVGVRYIRGLGKTAQSGANSANRSEFSVFDVIQGLEDLSFAQGFSGASDIRHSLSESGVVREIIRYVSLAEEIPFSYSIPAFPIVKRRNVEPSFAQAQENPPEEHIPSWLPIFPHVEAFGSSEKEKSSETGVVSEIQKHEEHHRNMERPLLNLQQRLLCNGSEAGADVDQGDAVRAQRVAETNPFLAPPLQHGEKEVSVPIIPANHLSEATGFHKSWEVTDYNLFSTELSLQTNDSERSRPCEPDDRRKILLNGRPCVHLRFEEYKKSFRVVTSPPNENNKKITMWFGDDQDGKDDKDMGIENILSENAETPPEASDL